MRHLWFQQSITENINLQISFCNKNVYFYHPLLSTVSGPTLWTKGRKSWIWISLWSIQFPFLIQVMSLVLIFNLEVTLGHTWRCPFLLQCKDLQLPESPRDVSSRGPTWQELGIRLRLVFKEVMKDLLIQLLKMLLTYGMDKGNRAAIDIHFLWINSQLFHLKSK